MPRLPLMVTFILVGQTADLISTWVALSRGYQEGNPILKGMPIWALVASKVAAIGLFMVVYLRSSRRVGLTLGFVAGTVGLYMGLHNIGVMWQF